MPLRGALRYSQRSGHLQTRFAQNMSTPLNPNAAPLAQHGLHGGTIPHGSAKPLPRCRLVGAVRFAHLARMACSLRSPRGSWVASFLTPHFSQGHGTPCHYASPLPHSSPLTSHQGQPQGLPLRPSRLTRARHAVPLRPTPSLLTPHSYDLTPHSSTPPSSPIILDLTPHSSLLPPHPSFLTCIKLVPEAVGTLALCAPPRCNPLPPLRWPPPLHRLCRIHRLYRLQRFYRLRHPCHPTAMKP